jgi:hypothetical protein
VRDHAADLREQFGNNTPFRHVVIDQFLDPAFCRELISSFPRFDASRAINERGETGRKSVVSDVAAIGPSYARFDRLMRDREFLSLTARITGIANLLYDPDYVGGGTHENLAGQDLDPHVDFNYHPSRNLHRRLNLIVFLNPEWEPSWGGCLELLRDPWANDADGRKVILPGANRGVIFETTEASWHGFPRIVAPPGMEISRRSIAVYFYTRTRPELEAAPSHGTIYYQRPLPDRIAPGYTLQEDDIEEVRSLMDRRDRQIRFLYDREKKFSQSLDAITGSASFRLGRAVTWPFRALRGLARR